MTESGTAPQAHRARLASIYDEVRHTIAPVETEADLARFTCGMHAFGFQNSSEYADIAGYGLGLVFAGPDFFRWLIDTQHLVEIEHDEPPPRSLVMYFNTGRPVHVGRMKGNNRIISKWGIGLLCEHAVEEVPEQYGSEVRFFRPVEGDDALEYFVAFAKERGIQFEC